MLYVLYFSRLLIASMQSICLEGLGGENKVDPRLQETTFIQHTFGGYLRSKVLILELVVTYSCLANAFFRKKKEKIFTTLILNEVIFLATRSSV